MTGVANRSIRVAIVDRQRIFAESLAFRLSAEQGIETVLSVCDGPDTESLVIGAAPDVVLLDIDLPNQQSFALAAGIRQAVPVAKLIFLADQDITDLQLEQALRMEVTGFLSKSDSCESLVRGVRQAVAGETAISPLVDSRLMFDSSRRSYRLRIDPPLKGLTERQIEILRHLARGESVKCVARRLQLSPKSVDGHKFRIMNKLGVRDKVGLALFAVREGLIQP